MPLPLQYGLLGDDESLAPNLGLLGRIANGSPVEQVAAAQAMRQGGPPAAQAPQAPGPKPQQPPPATRPVPQAPQLDLEPAVTPTQAGFLAAGQAVEGAPSFAHALSRALSAGVPAFLATRQQQREAKATIEAQRASNRQYQDFLDSEEARSQLDPGQIRFLRTLDATQGRAFVQKILEKDPLKVGEGETVIGRDGKVIAKGREKPIESEGRIFERDAQGNLVQVVGAKPKELTPDDMFSTAAEFVGVDPADRRNWTPEQRQAVDKKYQELKRSGANRTSTQINLPAGEGEFFKGIGTEEAKGFAERRNVALGAPQLIQSIDRGLQLLEEGNIYTGTGAEAQLAGAKAVAKVFGGDTEKIKNTEELRSFIQAQLIDQLKAMGARPSDRDMLELKKKVGDLSTNRESLQGIMDYTREMLTRRMEEHNSEVGTIRSNTPKGAVVPPTIKELEVPYRPVDVQRKAWDNLPAEERKKLEAQGYKRP